MYKVTAVFTLICVTLYADIVMKKSKPHDDLVMIPEHPIYRPVYPIYRPLYYPRESIPAGIIVETHADCSQYTKTIEKKERRIRDLESKLASMQLQLQNLQSKYNKITYIQETQKISQKKPAYKTKSRIIISDKQPKKQIKHE